MDDEPSIISQVGIKKILKNDNSLSKEGMIIGILAYTIWGLLPLYLKQFSDVSASEILIHRVIWALPFGFFIIYLRHQWHEVQETIKNKRKLGWLALAAFAISINWLTSLSFSSLFKEEDS